MITVLKGMLLAVGNRKVLIINTKMPFVAFVTKLFFVVFVQKVDVVYMHLFEDFDVVSRLGTTFGLYNNLIHLIKSIFLLIQPNMRKALTMPLFALY